MRRKKNCAMSEKYHFYAPEKMFYEILLHGNFLITRQHANSTPAERNLNLISDLIIVEIS